MRNSKYTTIALIFMLSFAILFVALPQIANAQLSIDTYAHLAVGPNPIGVGQNLGIVIWLDKPPPVPAQQTSTVRAIPYTNMTLKVTKPDNTESVLGPFSSDATGSYAMRYTPDQVGNYTFQFIFGGETIYGRRMDSGPMYTDYYKPSSSRKVTITVQDEPILQLPSNPLPTEYWTRPIDAQYYNWNTIAGNWLGIPLQFASGYSSDGNFNPYSAAPNTAHIMWTMQQAFGGLVGGGFNESSYYTGLSYQEKWNPPNVVVINGRLYYHKVAGPSAIVEGLASVDLRTGQEIWFMNATSISFGHLWKFETMNVHGVSPYLWNYRSGISTMYDAFTGRQLLQVSGCQSGKTTMSQNGDIMVYTLNAGRNWMSLWNSSKTLNPQSSLDWSPSLTRNYTFADGIMWNVTIPSISGQSIVQLGDGVIITATAFREATPPVRTLAGYDSATGQHLWTINLTDYTIRPQYNISPIIDGHFAWFKQETTQWYGFEARTGRQVWGPTEPYENSFGMYSASFRGAGGPNPQVAYGKIYTAGYDGRVHAIDIKTGKEEWTFYPGTAGLETIYGHYPFYGAPLIADDKVFVTSNEHTPNNPLWRGGKLWAMNATTGESIWNISSWMPGAIVADGYLLGLNYYDGKIYNIGKGPSSLTVEAPMNAAPLGSSITIRGTIMDISPGTKQPELTARFPNGVPAVSDGSQTAWMEYVYMQNQRPTDAKGVPIALSVVDANGNYREIGTAISTADGFFTFSWKPDIEGLYTVYASFAGTEAYWPSKSVTSFTVDQALSTPAPAATPISSIADAYFVPAIAGIFIAIAIVGILMVLMLRRRP